MSASPLGVLASACMRWSQTPRVPESSVMHEEVQAACAELQPLGCDFFDGLASALKRAGADSIELAPGVEVYRAKWITAWVAWLAVVKTRTPTTLRRNVANVCGDGVADRLVPLALNYAEWRTVRRLTARMADEQLARCVGGAR